MCAHKAEICCFKFSNYIQLLLYIIYTWYLLICKSLCILLQYKASPNNYTHLEIAKGIWLKHDLQPWHGGKNNLNGYWNGNKWIDLQCELYAKVTRGTRCVHAIFISLGDLCAISLWLILGEEFSWKKSFNNPRTIFSLSKQREGHQLCFCIYLIHIYIIFCSSFSICISVWPWACRVTSVSPKGTYQARFVWLHWKMLFTWRIQGMKKKENDARSRHVQKYNLKNWCS